MKTKQRKLFLIVVFLLIIPNILTLNLSFIIFNLYSDIAPNSDNQLNINPSELLGITLNSANGTYNKLNVTQYCQKETNISNKQILNTKLKTADSQSGVGDNKYEFNITVPNYYNMTDFRLDFKNITAQPTWRDIEQNTTSSFYVLYDLMAGSDQDTVGMSFDVSSDMRITKIAFYGYSTLRLSSNPGAYYSVEIWDRTSQWTGGPNKKLASITDTSDVSGWNEYSFNLNLTTGSYFVIINGSKITRNSVPKDEGVYWCRVTDSIEGEDEGSVYYWDGASWSEYTNRDLSLKVQGMMIDINNDSLKITNPKKVDLKVEVNSTTTSVPSNGTLMYRNWNTNGNVSVKLTTNSSVIMNITWNAWYFNETYSSISKYSGSINHQNATWNISFNVKFPENTYNYSYRIKKNSPSWVLTNAYNTTSKTYDKKNEIIKKNFYLYVLNGSILGESTWLFFLNNSLLNPTLIKNQSGTFGTDAYYTFGDKINLSVNMVASNGVLNLTVYDPNNVDVTTDWCIVSNAIVESFANFNLTVPNSAQTGYYTVQVVWDNMTYAGLSQIQISIINSTELNIITENEFPAPPAYRYVGEILNLTVFYNDTVQNKFTGISNANVTLKIINLTDSSVVLMDNLSKDVLGNGYYNYSIDTSGFINGSYRIIINASKRAYQNWSIQKDFDLIFNTTLSKFSPPDLIINSIYLENITINVNYSEYYTWRKIITQGGVTYRINNSLDTGVLIRQGDNTYQIQLNSTDYGVGYYVINITASLMGYETRTIFINWTITYTPTSLDISYNGSGSGNNEYIYRNDVQITVRYYTTGNNDNLTGASLQINGEWDNYNKKFIMNPITGMPGYYNYTFKDLPAGNWTLRVQANKTNFQSQDIMLTYIIINKATSQITSNISSTIYLHWNDTIYINLRVIDISNSLPIINSDNNLTGNLTIFGKGSKYLTNHYDGNYTFKLFMNISEISELTRAGPWKLNFTLDQNNYTSSSILIDFELISHTSITGYNRSYSISNHEYTYENETLIIWVKYIDTDFNRNITNAEGGINTNWSLNIINITYNVLMGLYKIEFNTTGIEPNRYAINISISKVYYDRSNIIIKSVIWSKNLTKLYFILSPPASIDAGSIFNIKVQLNQTDTTPETPLKGELIKLYINGVFISQNITDANGTVEFKGIIAFEKYSKTGMLLTIEYVGNYSKLQFTLKSNLINVKTGGVIENYWWVFLIIGIVVGIIAITGYVVNRQSKKKQSKLQKVVTSFTDVTNIQYLIVIHKEMGADIFQYSMGVDVDPTLLAGFIQAVKQFSMELTKEEEK